MARALRPGEPAPPFAARDETGRLRTSAEMKGRLHALCFYPADETRGCIAEVCAIRDAWPDFEALGLAVFGVSRDSVESHAAFARARRLPFPLLADVDGRLHEDYGAVHFGVLPRRVSYLVDKTGVIAAVYESHLRPAIHAERMLEAARAIAARQDLSRDQRP